ncbi:MAG: HlyD family secretion protein [Hyphomonadaceae bacterium]
MKRFALLLALALAACGAQNETLQGYAEADYVYVSPQDPGLVQSLAVREGDSVEAGAPLFTLNTDRAALQARAAEAQGDANRAASVNAAVAAAQANAALAQANLSRTRLLFQRGLVAQARLDADIAAANAASAAVRQAQAERASVSQDDAAAEAQADLARTQLRDRAVTAPVAARVERIFRRPGEYAQPGEPVVALLPPRNLKIRFFVPEPMLGALRMGQEVRVSCDGCADGLTARISFIASEPQFTPPVIYSVDQRERLVFLVEARLNGDATLRPGQPLDVRLR